MTGASLRAVFAGDLEKHRARVEMKDDEGGSTHVYT